VEEKGEISALSDTFQVSENEFQSIDISELKIQGIKVKALPFKISELLSEKAFIKGRTRVNLIF